MRPPAVIICFALILATQVRAQNQERTLVDRLLRPDMTLVNDAQNKKFRVKTASIDSRGTVGTFYLKPRVEQPGFSATRTISPQQCISPSSQAAAHREFGFSGRKSDAMETVSSSPVFGIQITGDSEKRIATSNFPDQRPFRGEGKSQKSFDRQNAPLTIEQVRELLNKNK